MTPDPKESTQGSPASNPWSSQPPNIPGELNPKAATVVDASTPRTGIGATQDRRYSHRQYLLEKQFWKMLGAAFRIYDENHNLVFYSKQKAFKLKEDIRVYSGEDMSQELLIISARNIIDFSSAYDVVDATTGQKIGAMKRKGFKSMLQDEWIILDASDGEIGIIKEDSTVLAIIRRFIEYASMFIPQEFNGTIGRSPVCRFKQNFNPFISKIDLDFSTDTNNLFDRRLGIAAAILICAIEGKQR